MPGPSAPSYTPMTNPGSIANTVWRCPEKRGTVASPSRRLEQRVGTDGDEHDEDDRVERRLGDVQADERPHHGADVGDARHRQRRAQVGPHPA